MGRHSRNNTASASFTKAEYGMLRDRWGSKRVKLGAESFKQFDQCSLCLNGVESPVVCNGGHLFCKECMYTSLLDQKKEFAAIKMQLVKLESEYEAQRDKARAEAMRRVQNNFESMQSGVQSQSRASRDSPPRRQSKSILFYAETSALDLFIFSDRDRSRSPARKNDTSLKDLPERIRIQTERAIQEAIDQLDKEHVQAKKDKIPAYWLPSLTPSADTKVEDVVRKTEEALEKGFETRCYVGDHLGHPVRCGRVNHGHDYKDWC